MPGIVLRMCQPILFTPKKRSPNTFARVVCGDGKRVCAGGEEREKSGEKKEKGKTILALWQSDRL